MVDESDETNNTAAARIQVQDAGLIGLYTFEDGTASNEAGGPSALPDLTAFSIGYSSGDAVLNSSSDYLELPVPLGNQAFTIWLDAAFIAEDSGTAFVLSQGASQSAANFDFYLQQFLGSTNSAAIYNAEGNGFYITNNAYDGARHQVALTWDGATFGSFFDNVLLTRSVGGTLPDIDGAALRLGQTLKGSAGVQGTLHEIQIFDRALSEAELIQLHDGDPVLEPDIEHLESFAADLFFTGSHGSLFADADYLYYKSSHALTIVRKPQAGTAMGIERV